VRTVVNLDGGWAIGSRRRSPPSTRRIRRFLTFALVNFADLDDADWSQREANGWRRLQGRGQGLKFHKSFGLSYRYRDGKLMSIDDPKLDPIWETCANTNGRWSSTLPTRPRSSRRWTASMSAGTN